MNNCIVYGVYLKYYYITKLFFLLLTLQIVLGKNIQRPAKLDKRLARELKALSDPEDPYDTVMGKTMCTYDFYEGIVNFIVLFIKLVLNLTTICYY